MDQTENEAAERDRSLMEIGFWDSALLFALFVTLSIGSTFLIAQALINASEGSLDERTIIYALCLSSLCGSSIFYSRKLYKAGINKTYNFNPTEFGVARLSTIAYFLTRIPTSVVLSIISYALWRLSISITVDSKFQAHSASIYLFIVMGFVCGFSSGRLISHFERDGMSIIKGNSSNG